MGRDILKVSCKKKGDIIEIKALSFLLDNGFEVFRNESSVGPVDIVALDIKKNEVILIDVKTSGISKSIDGSHKVSFSTKPKTEIQKDLSVQFLFYDKIGNTFTWEKDI